MKCSICGEEIDKQVHPTTGEVYWDRGHNPQPVLADFEARCCTACNNEVVIPVRLGAPRDLTVEQRRLRVRQGKNKAVDSNWHRRGMN